MKVTPAQIAEVCKLPNPHTELLRLRRIVGIPGPGSGRHSSYDETTADVLVTVWFSQSAFIQSFGPKGTNWALWSSLAKQLLAAPDELAFWDRWPMRVELALIRTDWSSVAGSPARNSRGVYA